ncbi:glycosyltransferase [Geoalkalibacter sp.]|uniref:glycosyltransferase n=1 Tax=Geoalkalibacter sp. TaxID=3041440 RepID=UPI00272E1C8A|nr:glycosyltransferase [Geoalkalibacter sp.]
MNIAMFTNTYAPHVGGVARSVLTFSNALRRRGHRVLVVAPEFEEMPHEEPDVLRLPAWRHFSEGNFSVPLPLPGRITRALNALRPDIMHAHHPFLLGETALRAAHARNLPVVFTHHTLYERYTHYLPGDSPGLRQFAVELATGFCNLCDAVIAPSSSVARLLKDRGVRTSIEVIPTGVDLSLFRSGDGQKLRRQLNLSPATFLIGHVGRLAPEKEPLFLAAAVARHLLAHPDSHFLLIGSGPSAAAMEALFAQHKLTPRLHRQLRITPEELADAYAAMDAFVFASRSETQGLVLTEAMAAGVPVIAVDGPGVCDVVQEEHNGRLLEGLDEKQFAARLDWLADLPQERRRLLRRNARHTAEDYSLDRTVDRLVALYERLHHGKARVQDLETSRWATAQRFFAEEFKILANLAHAAERVVHRREGN